MADDNSRKRGRIDRRKFVGGLGVGAGLTLAGCIGDDDDPDDDDDTEATASPTPDPEDIPEGGTVHVATVAEPETLNPLVSTSAYASAIWGNIYDWGTTLHPEDQSFRPWAIEDWSMDQDNVGTSEPTVTATLRNDLSFTDGEPVTAEDVEFTINYILEQDPGGTVGTTPFLNLDEVTYDSPDGYELNYFFEEPELQWFTGTLGSVILPKHIWEDVDDHSQYEPRDDGMVGSGVWELEDYAWDQWFELSFRDSDEVPQTTHEEVDWIHDDAPFLDTWRIEIFGSETAAEEAVMDGEADVLFTATGASIDMALDAQESDHLSIYESPDLGYYHNSFNLRRVPYDDKAFRQFLVRTFDKDWVVDDLNEGIAAVKGDYVVLPEFDHFRPDPPWETDEYDGIELPDLEFPGTDFDLTEDEIQELRDFLVEHPDAIHDYSWEEATSEHADSPDGQILHVNGEPLEEAHTDNDGEAGQGPLEMITYPADDFEVRNRYSIEWVQALQEIGVPTEAEILTFAASSDRIWIELDFDMFTRGWGLGAAMTHLVDLYSSAGADLEGDMDAPMFNGMAYTGADDLIFEDAGIMDFDEREETLPPICAQMWQDAPTEITQFHNLLEPVSNDFVGWQEDGPGSLIADKTLEILNVRRADN